MITFDRCRRAACVVLVVAFLVMIPSMATAKFTSSQAPSLSVSTATMPAPSNLAGTYKCVKSGTTESMQVTFTTFTYTGPTGSTYGFGLALGSVIQDSTTSATKTVTLNASKRNDGVPTTWTVGAQAFLKNWSSAVGSENILCPASGNQNGSF